MSQSRKHRGYRTEKVVAAYLKSWWPHAEATGAGRAGKDVTGVPFDCEIKARTGFSPKAWIDQVKARTSNSGELGFCVLRLNGQGEDVSDYAALIRFEDLVNLLRKSGFVENAPEVVRCKGCGSWVFGSCSCQVCEKVDYGK